jgi:hypothetical protein
MSNVTPTSASPASASSASTPATPAAPKTRRAQRSQALDGAIARARIIATALGPLLPGIAEADAEAAKVRIDASWVGNLVGVIASAEAAQGERVTAIVGQKAATTAEHQAAAKLVELLTAVRELVATHNPDDLAAQQAYGRGEKIDAKHVAGALEIGRAFVAAYGGEWKEAAVDAGVTDATMAEIATLTSSLATAAVSQHAAQTAGSQKTLSRAAAVKALRSLCAFAVRVVKGVYGKGSPQLATLADPRPRQARGAARKLAAKANAKAASARKAAKKAASRAKPGARAKTRARKARTAAVATRAAALVKGAANGATGAKAKKTGAKAEKTGAKAKKTGAKAEKTGAKAKKTGAKA